MLLRLRVDTCRNTRIDSDSILAFLCIALLLLVMKNRENSNIFMFRKLDAMQCKGLASYCEPALRVPIATLIVLESL